ncbi:MAG: hypothetical protein QM702_21595 [Rubrivivax sp.]
MAFQLIPRTYKAILGVAKVRIRAAERDRGRVCVEHTYIEVLDEVEQTDAVDVIVVVARRLPVTYVPAADPPARVESELGAAAAAPASEVLVPRLVVMRRELRADVHDGGLRSVIRSEPVLEPVTRRFSTRLDPPVRAERVEAEGRRLEGHDVSFGRSRALRRRRRGSARIARSSGILFADRSR